MSPLLAWIGGVRAKTADHKSLRAFNEAVRKTGQSWFDMSEKNQLALLAKFGWQKGAMGRAEFEKVDPMFTDAATNMTYTDRRASMMLADAFEDSSEKSELLKAYPQLSEVRVLFDPTGSNPLLAGARGVWRPELKTIILDTRKTNPMSIWTNTLHEMQHAIDNYEGYDGGNAGNPRIKDIARQSAGLPSQLQEPVDISELGASARRMAAASAERYTDNNTENYERAVHEVRARNVQTRAASRYQDGNPNPLLEVTEDRNRAIQIRPVTFDQSSDLQVRRDVPVWAPTPSKHMRQASKGGNTRSESEPLKVRKETYDTPTPDGLRPAYDAWYGQLPKNLQYTGDYDLQGTWLERLGRPTKYEATQNGHLDDYGKKPNHPTFSSGSKWHDPKVPERTGGEWKKAADGSWDFYPGTGNVLTDEQLKDYFDKYEKGNRVHPRNVRQAAKAGDAGESKSSAVTSGHNSALDGYAGPRIIINPKVMRKGDERDALCVGWNEAIRVFMEANGYEPQSEPTEKQRRFFADTPYADDELQLRRTILARICVFDTSVKDPTDDQLSESASVLRAIIDSGFAKTDDEITKCERLARAIEAAIGAEPVEPKEEPIQQAPLQPNEETQADDLGGQTDKDEFLKNAQAQADEAAKLAAQGPDAEERKMQAMAEAAGAVQAKAEEAEGNHLEIDGHFGHNEEMKAAAQEAGLKADIAEAVKLENMAQGANGHFIDAQGRVISKRAAASLAEQNIRNGAAQQDGKAEGQPQSASERIGTTSGATGIGGRTLTAGEVAWQAKRQASTEAWMQRTGRNGIEAEPVGEQPAQIAADDKGPLKPNNLFQNTQVDSGRRDALGRKLDNRGRVIA